MPLHGRDAELARLLAAAQPALASAVPLLRDRLPDATEVGSLASRLALQGIDVDLSKRLIDFSSGLTYALDGGMQRIADKVFLLTPPNIEVSAEERAKALERGGFYNRSEI